MNPLGAAVDTQQAIQLWGVWFSVLLAMNSVLTMLVIGFFWKKSREWASRWSILTNDLEVLTEMFVPRDEKGRALHINLIKSMTEHYDMMKTRSHWSIPDRETLTEMADQLAQMYEWQNDRATGEWCRSCEVSDCPPLKVIYDRILGVQEDIGSMRGKLDTAAGDVSMTREELRQALKESYEKFYGFLTELSRAMLTRFKEQADDRGDAG